jgi:hypothetical protein
LELRDLIVTPLFIILIYGVAYAIRSSVTDEVNRVYFIPALTVKIIGALALGFIYQFYYQGGDTFSYHTHGSRHIWETFMESPEKGIELLLTSGQDQTRLYKYSSKIWFFTDPSSYAVVRIAAVVDLFTFSTYSATALLFSVFSFIGMWMLFLTFYERYPYLHRWLAIASFFIPSVFFWGSGLLKDTLTIGCLGMVTYQTSKIFLSRKNSLGGWVLLTLSLSGIYIIKLYILLTFLPALILWVFLGNLQSIRSMILKIMLFPFVISTGLFFAYFATLKAGESNSKYALNSLAKTAQVTAYDIRYWTGRDAGSGYSIGELDGTFGSMIKLAPQAINVSFFRPYLWEVNNPLMLLSALESLFLLLFCIYIFFAVNIRIVKALSEPTILFTLVFAISFAFAVGVSTFNFGTLVRYKIPMMPFFLIALILILHHSKSDKKLVELEITE